MRPYNQCVGFRPIEHPKKCILAALLLISAQILLSLSFPRSFGLTAFGDLTQCMLLLAVFFSILSSAITAKGGQGFSGRS